jgi:predicted nucleic acid-binding Zn ribbon protein
MADEQIVRLLEEIRDLQKQHMENYKLALANQQKALDTQKQALRRTKVLLVAIGAVIIAIVLLPIFGWGLSWSMRCLLRQ